MKLYRDMTPAERAAADREHQRCLEWDKECAEIQMMRFDSLTPAEREAERNEEFADFY
jgi:hypothetical protein